MHTSLLVAHLFPWITLHFSLLHTLERGLLFTMWRRGRWLTWLVLITKSGVVQFEILLAL